MKRRFFGSAVQITLVVLLIAIALVIVFGGGDETDDSTIPPSVRFGGERQAQMTVSIIEPSEVVATVEVEATGAISYRNTVDIVSQVSGRVVWFSATMRNGASFEANDVLFRIDPVDAQLSVEQAKADLQVALADMNLTKAEQAAAIENYLLLNPDSEVPPLVAKQPQLARSEAAISRAKARLRVAELALSRTEFKLPFNGRVLNSSIGEGKLVAMNQVLGQVYNIDELEAVIPLASLDVEVLNPLVGRNVRIKTEHGYISAEIERESAELDSRTRTTTAYARLLSDEHSLVPGYFIEATVIGNTVESAYILPNEVEQANGTVWLVRDGQILSQPIRIQDRRTDGLLVDSFNYYDGIVVGSMPDLQEGTMVRTVEVTSS